MTIFPNHKKNAIVPVEKRQQIDCVATNAGQWMKNQINANKKQEAQVVSNEYFAVLGCQSNWELPNLSKEIINNTQDGFVITANNNGVCIQSPHPRGVIYGWQTVKSLWEQNIFFNGTVIDFPDSTKRMFHMDLRYGLPSFQRMLEIIDELSQARFNYFILEYENRFPFKEHSAIRAKEHFKDDEIKEMQKYAADKYIEIIPLQQTIGHLEYMLKIPEYNHLREVREFPKQEKPYTTNAVGFKYYNDIDEICASNEKAYSVVESMLNDIILGHKDSKYIHIGCDEAWNLLSCEKCRKAYGNKGKNILYIKHINRMAKIVLSHGKTPIIWDDMLRAFSDKELEMLDKNIVIMIWLYYKSQQNLAKQLIYRFEKAGFQVLGAAAAKCGEGPEPQNLDMPWYDQRINNVQMWGELCKETSIDGFCMTVWSNYSGTIAPPHPFFDTIWYPVIYASEVMWNNTTGTEDFDLLFSKSFFGVEAGSMFKGFTEEKIENMQKVADNAKKHKYEADVLLIMQWLNVYRIKSLAIARELYKLDLPESLVTDAEKRIVNNRAKEIVAMRSWIEPEVERILNTHYSKYDTKIFLDSRFSLDKEIYKEF